METGGVGVLAETTTTGRSRVLGRGNVVRGVLCWGKVDLLIVHGHLGRCSHLLRTLLRRLLRRLAALPGALLLLPLLLLDGSCRWGDAFDGGPGDLLTLGFLRLVCIRSSGRLCFLLLLRLASLRRRLLLLVGRLAAGGDPRSCRSGMLRCWGLLVGEGLADVLRGDDGAALQHLGLGGLLQRRWSRLL